MSRSYRRPYSSFGGHQSQKKYKVLAHRAVRRLFRHRMQNVVDWEDFAEPKFREARGNNPYGWSRDASRLRPVRIGRRSFTALGLGDDSHYQCMLKYIEKCKRK